MNPHQSVQRLITILIVLNLLCLISFMTLNVYQTMTIHTYNNKIVELEANIGPQSKILNDLNSSSTRIEGQLKFIIGHMFKVEKTKGVK